MGIFDSVLNRVKDNLTYHASDSLTDVISKGASKVLNKEKILDKCPKCKIKIKDSNLKFCPKCGAKLIATCSECKVDYPIGTKFCTQCGTKLK